MDLCGFVPYSPVGHGSEETTLQRPNCSQAPRYLRKQSVNNCDRWLNAGVAIALGSLSTFILTGAIVKFSLHQTQTPQVAQEIPADLTARALSHLP
jgi:hypothetical protein